MALWTLELIQAFDDDIKLDRHSQIKPVSVLDMVQTYSRKTITGNYIIIFFASSVNHQEVRLLS